MTERVEAVALGVTWNSVRGALLVSSDVGDTSLRLRAHPNDPDQRDVLLIWNGVMWAHIGMPNDEARSGHRLFPLGLDAIVWIGEVTNSRLIHELEAVNSVHQRHDPDHFWTLRHWIVPLKESTAEVVGRSLTVERDTRTDSLG